MTADFDALVAHRLPLAEATLRLLNFAFDAAVLRTVFDHHHGRPYEHDLAFPTFVQLILDALIGHRGFAHQSFQQADQNDRLPVSVQALYGKRRRVPLDLIVAPFTHTAQRLQTVAPPATTQPLPASVHGFQVVAFDGKKLKSVCDFPLMHRLRDGADHFLIRSNSACKFHVDPGIPSRTGTDTRGRCYAEEWGGFVASRGRCPAANRCVW